MPKEVKYPERVAAKITKEQKDKITRSGMSDTEFIRKAIDFYDGARLSSFTAMKLNVINDCIGALNVFRENVKNSDENTFNLLRENVKNVTQNGGQTLHETPNTYNVKEDNDVLLENVKRNTYNESTENVKRIDLEEQEKKEAEQWEAVKNTLTDITTSKGKVSKRRFQDLAKKCGKTAGELESYYNRHIKYFRRNVNKMTKI